MYERITGSAPPGISNKSTSLWNRVVLARRFLNQRWLLSMTNVLLHLFLPDVMQRRRREDPKDREDTKTSPLSPKCQRGLSFVVEVADVSDYLQLLWHSI
ncbi:hypothetical protein DAPPUDRAFT_246408 [Daphnia pulex]|uniref:Uncharacterized protein n=1 Tax=Daphnia pulex TaxID=6669 RepID=E9GQF2_DAPPU|nr:hypothetical protein DAPPUDRAFT_246408 [Daphnia pulex]|eukprot:EFX78348.1 hypothetical protein DAPPUDRAFT_246408 [Daphnia pulex]